MSIYATWMEIGDADHTPDCAVFRLLGEYPLAEAFGVPGGAMIVGAGDLERVFARVPGAACTCGNPAPLVYQGSHVCPSSDGPRGGSVTFCGIPDYCHPDVTAEMRERDEGYPVEFARLWVTEDEATYGHEKPGNGSAVVLERAQVARLRDTLTRWLEAKARE